MLRKLARSLVVLLAAAFVVANVGCGKKDGVTSITQPTQTVSVSPSAVKLPSSGAAQQITVTGTASWSIAPSASWVSVSPASGGPGTTVVVVSGDSNTGTVIRTATLAVPGANPVSVSQDAVVVETPIADTSSLAADVRAYIVSSSYTMQTTRIQRMTGPVVKVYPGPYSPDLVLRAANAWKADTGLTFQIVGTEAEANISVANVTVPVGCGNADLNLSALPLILGGKVSDATGLKSGCSDQGDNIEGTISHEIGHILGFGHSTGVNDLMDASPGSLKLAASTSTAVRWVYSQTLGAVIK